MKNKTAFITGASKGIGFAIAQSLVKESVNVCITARNKDDLETAANKLNKINSGRAIAVYCDVKNYQSQVNAVHKTIEQFGSLDYLIANAGIGHFANIADLSIEQWQDTIDTNLTGVFYSVKATLEELSRTKGYIITISSLAGKNTFAGGSAYNASKFGLNGFSEAIMLDLRYKGIKVTTIMPGSVSSYFGGRSPEEGKDWRIQPEDIGQMIVDLLKMPARTLPSRVEVRPSIPNRK